MIYFSSALTFQGIHIIKASVQGLGSPEMTPDASSGSTIFKLTVTNNVFYENCYYVNEKLQSNFTYA
jgi:hypothetical protein